MLIGHSWYRPRIALVATVVSLCLGLGIVLTAICGPDRILVSGTVGYTITGEFSVNETLPMQPNLPEAAAAQSKGIVLWRSLEDAQKNTGKLVSPPFRSPAILGLFVSAWTNSPHDKLLIERVDTGEQISLRLGNLSERWTKLEWLPPLSWYGHSVRLMAINAHRDSAASLGVSSPLQISSLNLLAKQFRLIAIVPLYTICFVLFLVPGLLIAKLIVESYKLHSALSVILAIAVNALLGYVTFWVYFLNNTVGVRFSFFILFVTIQIIVFLLLYRRRSITAFLITEDVAFPSILMLVVGLTYLLALYIIDLGVSSESVVDVRFWHEFPPDNVLPRLFAEKLYAGQDPRPLMGDWLSSDRPPLQVGIILLQRPFAALYDSSSELHYQILGTIVQCSWLAAIWALCRVLGFRGWRIAQVMAFSIFSGFFFFNTIYVWPKLLAGAMVILAFVLLAPAVFEARRPSTAEVGLAGIAAALGMLSHGGVVFTLPAIALMLVRPRSFPALRQIVVGLLVFGLLLAPWSAYQKFYEPPGDRLLKWHLAGVVHIDSHSATQAIKDSYQHLSFTQIANNKWENLKALLDSSEAVRLRTTAERATDLPRQKEFFHLARGLGILNLGWLLWLTVLFGWLKLATAPKRLHLVLGVSVFSLLFWVLVMFGPATTVIHQGSYATVILLFVGLTALLTQLPRLLVYIALAFQTVVFVTNWLISTTFRSVDRLPTAPNIFLLGLMLLSFVGIIYILRRLTHASFVEEDSTNRSVSHAN